MHKVGIIHADCVDGVCDGFGARIGAIDLRRQCQLTPRVVIPGTVLETMGRLPRQSSASLRLHLDAAEQVRHRLPGQQFRSSSAAIAFRKGHGGIESSSHDPHAHGADQDSGAVKASRDDGCARTGRTQHVLDGHPEVGVFDVRARASSVTGGWHLTQHFERARSITLDIGDGDEENHDGVGRLVRAGVRRAADNALEICAFKIPASAISGPDLFPASVVWNERCIGGVIIPSLHSAPTRHLRAWQL